MGMCKGCGEVFSALYMKNGYCENCYTDEIAKSFNDQEERIELVNNNKNLYKKVIVTTEMSTTLDIDSRIGIVTAQTIYGLNIITDFFASIRDIVGGRINSIESALETASEIVVDEIQKKAFLKGANAVIGLKIEHTYNNAKNGNILSVYATGTIVTIKGMNTICPECNKTILSDSTTCPHCGAPQNNN